MLHPTNSSSELDTLLGNLFVKAKTGDLELTTDTEG